LEQSATAAAIKGLRNIVVDPFLIGAGAEIILKAMQAPLTQIKPSAKGKAAGGKWAADSADGTGVADHAFGHLSIEHEGAGRYRAAGQTNTGFGVADRGDIADVSGKNDHRATLALPDATAAWELDPVAFAEIEQRAVGGAPCKRRAGPVEPNLVALIGKDGGRGVGVDTNDSEKISNFGTPRTIKPRVTSRRMAGGPQR
jgi:hypothetical protein